CQNPRQNILRRNCGCRNCDLSDIRLSLSAETCLNLLFQINHLFCVAVENGSILGQTHLFCISDKQPYIHLLFHRGNMCADRRLCQIQLPCRFGNALLICNTYECLHLFYIHKYATLSLSAPVFLVTFWLSIYSRIGLALFRLVPNISRTSAIVIKPSF